MLLVLLPLTALVAFTALKWERFSQQSPHNQEFCCTIILPHWVLLAAVAVQKKKKKFLVIDPISFPSCTLQVPANSVQHLPGDWDPLLHPVRHWEPDWDHRL